MNKYLLALSLSIWSSLFASDGIVLSKDYQKNSVLQWDGATSFLKNVSFGETDKVLDVGCGDGKITALIAAQIPKGTVVGLDISQEMLAHASSHFPLPNLLFVQGDATKIPFKEQFDKLYCSYTLHWILDLEKALRSLKESIKPGGALFLILAGKNESNIGVCAEKLARSEKWASYFPEFKQTKYYPTPEECLSLLEKLDLEIQTFNVIETVTNYQNKEGLMGYLRPLVRYADHLSLEMREEFISDIANLQMEADIVYSDGSVGLKVLKIEVIATRPIE